MGRGLHSVIWTKEVGGNPDFYQEVTLTALYQQVPFDGRLSTITMANDSPTDDLEFSYDGATLAGVVKPGESLVLHVDQKDSIWIRGTAGGDDVRLFGWVSSITASSIKTSAQPLGVVNKSYEGTLIAGISPLILDFNADAGRNAVDGWITCDGTGVEMTVAFSRDGITFGDDWTIRSGENTGVRNFDIDQLRLTHTGDDVPYRVVLI
jgi:hypothetical protein